MKDFVVVRKSIKPYVKSYIQDVVHSITTNGEQHVFLDDTLLSIFTILFLKKGAIPKHCTFAKFSQYTSIIIYGNI